MFFRTLVLILVSVLSFSARAQAEFYGFLSPSVEIYGSFDPMEVEKWASLTIKDVRACFVRSPFVREVRLEVSGGRVAADSVTLSVSYNNGFDELGCVRHVLFKAELGDSSGTIRLYTTGRARRWREDFFYGRVGSPELYIGGVLEPQRFSAVFDARDRELAYTCLASSRLDEARLIIQVRAAKLESVQLMQGGRMVDHDDKDSAAAYACLNHLIGREYPDQMTRTPVTLVYTFERTTFASSSK